MTRNQIEDYFELLLEDEDLENILERYNVEPLEALMKLYDIGLIEEPYFDNQGNEDEDGS